MSQTDSRSNFNISRSEINSEHYLNPLVPLNETIRRSIPTSGIVLGTIARENSRETRYSWDTINGHSYLRIQDFQFDVRYATWAPVKGRCFTVRVHELAAVKTYIQMAIDHALSMARTEAEPTATAKDIGFESLCRDLRDVK
jgi:hypothetical protein